jgi:hypothetical protein
MPVIISAATSGATTIQATDAVTAVITLPSATDTLVGKITPSFTTTIGVGNATPSASGAGITFPATQSESTDANTLDDYEEGTFTPTMIPDGTAGTTTYSTQLGYYTKVGRLVTFQIYLEWTAQTGTGNILCRGLPFTSITTGVGFPVSIKVTNITFTANSSVTAQVQPNATVIYPLVQVNGSAAATIALDTAGEIGLSGCYFTS